MKTTVKKTYCVACGQIRDHLVTVTKKVKNIVCTQCGHKTSEKLS
jgi:DNA-directed RNA polymerase subunit RPC12/RpoP